MATFIATLSYELHPSTDDDARKLFRAELVGHRWLDRFKEEKMPANTLWIRRTAEDHQTTDDVHAACAGDVHAAVAAIQKMGRKIALVRAWIQVSGAGTYGLAPRAAAGTTAAGGEAAR